MFFIDKLYSTVGCHPTRCNEFDEFAEGPEGYIEAPKKDLDQILFRSPFVFAKKRLNKLLLNFQNITIDSPLEYSNHLADSAKTGRSEMPHLFSVCVRGQR